MTSRSLKANDARNAARTRKIIPDKTNWGLQDILAECAKGRKQLGKANEIAEQKMDLPLLLALSRLCNHLNAIERKASDALNGEYKE